MKGHREAVSGIKWMDFNTVVSSGWDHLIKIWDCELGGLKQEIAGEKYTIYMTLIKIKKFFSYVNIQ